VFIKFRSREGRTFVSLKYLKAMSTRGVSNVNMRSRMKQILLLVLAIIIGVIVSQGVQAAI
jgi:hypothetical protein